MNDIAIAGNDQYNHGMQSSFFSLLLVVNVLACPVRCISCEANVAVGESCAAAACTCCSDGMDFPVSETPLPCSNDCSCQNCICEGAMVEVEIEVPDSVDQVVAWIQPTLSGNQVPVVLNEISLRRSRAPLGQFLCGRHLRVAYQSWLI